MAKKDFLNVFALSPEKAAAEDLKRARLAELEAREGRKFPLNGVNRLYGVSDAVRFNLSDDTIKNLMTPSARKKLEELSKPI